MSKNENFIKNIKMLKLYKYTELKSKFSPILIKLFSTDGHEKPIKRHIAEDKAKLQWRTPIADRPGEWYSKFKLFAPEKDTNPRLISALTQPIDLTPSGIKKWYTKRKVTMEKHMQSFIPERHKSLGNDLAAAHFVVHRGGTVKFTGQNDWVKLDENNEYELPTHFNPAFTLEAVKCDNMELYYEGIANIYRLNKLKFLSFANVDAFDDWCLDRVSGSGFPNLEVLDLSGTKVTANGLNCLYRLPSLKLLIIDNVKESKSMEYVCALIEEFNPKIKIKESKEIHHQLK